MCENERHESAFIVFYVRATPDTVVAVWCHCLWFSCSPILVLLVAVTDHSTVLVAVFPLHISCNVIVVLPTRAQQQISA